MANGRERTSRAGMNVDYLRGLDAAPRGSSQQHREHACPGILKCALKFNVFLQSKNAQGGMRSCAAWASAPWTQSDTCTHTQARALTTQHTP